MTHSLVDVLAVDDDLACCGLEIVDEHAKGGRFAGAIRS